MYTAHEPIDIMGEHSSIQQPPAIGPRLAETGK